MLKQFKNEVIELIGVISEVQEKTDLKTRLEITPTMLEVTLSDFSHSRLRPDNTYYTVIVGCGEVMPGFNLISIDDLLLTLKKLIKDHEKHAA